MTHYACSSGKQTKQDEEDLAEVHALMARAAKEMEIEAVQLMEGMKKDKELMKRLVEIKQRQKDKPEGNLAEGSLVLMLFFHSYKTCQISM